MATKIHGITSNQSRALEAAFGYESYPNGNHGFPEKAASFLKEKSLIQNWSRGNAHSCGRVVAKRHWPKQVLRELYVLAQKRGQSSSWPW